jgi:hypothetical protein
MGNLSLVMRVRIIDMLHTWEATPGVLSDLNICCCSYDGNDIVQR